MRHWQQTVRNFPAAIPRRMRDFRELPLKGAIFDFDGTLVDSMYMWKEIDREYLKRYGHEMTDDLQQAIEGMSQDEMSEYFRNRYHIPRTNREMQEEWFEMARYKYLHEVQLKPGVREMLQYLKDRQIPMAVATSFVNEIMEPCLERLGIRDMFQAIVTTQDAGCGKESPAVFLRAAEMIGAEPSRCVVFEDLPVGLRSAKNVGMTTVAVFDAYSEDREEEKRKYADYSVRTMDELL